MGKIIVSIPDEFLKTIDKAAKQEHRSRSEFLREAIRLYLRQKPTGTIPLRENPSVQWAIKAQDTSRRKLRYPKITSQEAIRLLRGKI